MYGRKCPCLSPRALCAVSRASSACLLGAHATPEMRSSLHGTGGPSKQREGVDCSSEIRLGSLGRPMY